MKLIQRMMRSIGIGSFAFLLFKLVSQTHEITRNEILFVFFLSAFIGVVSLIERIEKLNYLQIILLHFISTYAFSYFLLVLLNGSVSVHFERYTITFVSIYFIVWLCLIIRNFLRARLLNKRIQIINTRHSGISGKKEE